MNRRRATPDRTVANWLAEGETAIAVFCGALRCGYDTIPKLLVLLRQPIRKRSDSSAPFAKGAFAEAVT